MTTEYVFNQQVCVFPNSKKIPCSHHLSLPTVVVATHYGSDGVVVVTLLSFSGLVLYSLDNKYFPFLLFSQTECLGISAPVHNMSMLTLAAMWLSELDSVACTK